MHPIVRRVWDVPESHHTPEGVYRERRRHRREFLESVGRSVAAVSGLGTLLGTAGCMPSPEEVTAAGSVAPLPMQQASLYPAQRDDRFDYGRPETERFDAAKYTNFYEFSSGKECFRFVEPFQTSPWSFEVTGLCAKPRTFDLRYRLPGVSALGAGVPASLRRDVGDVRAVDRIPAPGVARSRRTAASGEVCRVPNGAATGRNAGAAWHVRLSLAVHGRPDAGGGDERTHFRGDRHLRRAAAEAARGADPDRDSRGSTGTRASSRSCGSA